MKAAGHGRARAPRARPARGRAPGSAGRSRRSAPARRRPRCARRRSRRPGSSCSDSRYTVPPTVDVEHVHLAVDRAVLAVGADVHARCCGRARRPRRARRSTRRRGRPPARARRARAQLSGGAVERLGARGGLLGRAEHGPLLGQDDELAPRRRRPRERAGRPPRGCGPGPAVEFSWTAPARTCPLPWIDWSVNAREDTLRPCRSTTRTRVTAWRSGMPDRRRRRFRRGGCRVAARRPPAEALALRRLLRRPR